MEILIEGAKISDTKSLVTIYHDAYSENEEMGFPTSASKVTTKEVEDWIKETILYIARLANSSEAVGVVRFKYSSEWNCYVLSRLGVKSIYKGKGIAKSLMEYGESELLKMGERTLRLTVAQGHPYLLKMYEKRGYKIVGERPLPELPYDEFIMEKLL
ncbi:GNAT family N-acetyltransferase [Cytobacillus gottheilii]|uniref:GNAT family N-acetyltransferase n=1 Tax=Cytobacillus gottheilii TaxID=859144 RepID=UPI000832CAC7|nr:GNAT family N-acetyltransferase [Cytobacillus gottheilii]